MPRDGSGNYTLPFPPVVTNTTIASAVENGTDADIAQDLNAPRPVVAGGTGATNADQALSNLSAEKARQVVTNWDSMTGPGWMAGSFYAATSATGAAPVAGHAFAGIIYNANVGNLVCEATDLTDPANPVKWIRIMVAGVWGNWLLASGGAGTTGDYTFDNTLTFPPASGQVRFNNATENSTTEIFISHLNALGVDNTGTLSASLKSGYDIFVQDKDEPAKYKIFTANASPVITGGDFRITVGLKTAGLDIVSGQRVIMSISTGSAVVYDVAQGLTVNQMAQGRANISVTKKNYVINGGMMISQENGLQGGTTNLYYAADQFYTSWSHSGTPTFRQLAIATPGGSPNRIQYVASIADATVDASDFCQIATRVEGLRMADLKAGTASAKTVTLQFGVRAPAGTYCIALFNGAANRNYVTEYTVSAGEANTDTVKSVTFTLDVTGTWATDNTTGLDIRFVLMGGSSYRGTPNVWGSAVVLCTSNQFNLMGTTNNTFDLFDVSLTEGSVAPPFQVPDYASELLACRRYYWKWTALAGAEPFCMGYLQGTTTAVGVVRYPVTLRATPTTSMTGNWQFNQTGGTIGFTPTGTISGGPDTGILYGTTPALTAGSAGRIESFVAGVSFTANARL